MAVKTTDVNTINEQWHKTISTIYRSENPIQTLAGSESAGAPVVYWFTDSLDQANEDNAAIQGAEFANASYSAPVKRANHTQIFQKTVDVSRTVRSSTTLGTNDELARQMDLKTRAVKQDVEKALAGAQGSVEAEGAVAGRLAGLEAMIGGANALHGVGGSTPGYTSPIYGDVVAGDVRELTESLFNDGMQAAWSVGGTPDTVLVNGTLKRKISTFTGNSTKYQDANKKKIFNTVDTYVGDFGTYSVIPHHLMSTTTVLGIDPDKLVISYLDTWKKIDQAKTTDADVKTIIAELTLKNLDERSHFKIADVSAAPVAPGEGE
jgi:hypothetical protein